VRWTRNAVEVVRASGRSVIVARTSKTRLLSAKMERRRKLGIGCCLERAGGHVWGVLAIMLALS